jgi:hypothetical protein
MPVPVIRKTHQGDAIAFAPEVRRIIYTTNAIAWGQAGTQFKIHFEDDLVVTDPSIGPHQKGWALAAGPLRTNPVLPSPKER